MPIILKDMTTEHYIYYRDRFGTTQKFKMSDAFNQWVDYHGGKKQFLEVVGKMSNSSLYTSIDISFMAYFQKLVGGEIIFHDENINNDFLLNPDFYIMYIKRVAEEYENRTFSPQSIFTIVVMVLAIFGLIKMCSN